jgi:glycosyltransferase involved in cell wall biosynthesis
MVLIEAMACGIPIISTQCGSIPEVVGDSAILVSPHDFVELSNALAKLIDDAELRKNLRIKGIKRAKLLYDSNKTSLKLNKIYKNLLDS